MLYSLRNKFISSIILWKTFLCITCISMIIFLFQLRIVKIVYYGSYKLTAKSSLLESKAIFLMLTSILLLMNLTSYWLYFAFSFSIVCLCLVVLWQNYFFNLILTDVFVLLNKYWMHHLFFLNMPTIHDNKYLNIR